MNLFEQSMRWYGPNDPVLLSDILQSGASSVVTALHHIPVGDVWSSEEIIKRKETIEKASLLWHVVESLPVSEAIKTMSSDATLHIKNYKESIINLAAQGIRVITYNFMPVLDWSRTNVNFELPDGGRTLLFEYDKIAAFDIFILHRQNAEMDYTPEQIERARNIMQTMTSEQKDTLVSSMLMGLPGSSSNFTLDGLRTGLETYSNINRMVLRENLVSFLNEIAPIADECGVMLAIHPDDPCFDILGLPRIMSTADDFEFIISRVPNKSVGLCLCTGSLSSNPNNDLVEIATRFSGQGRVPFAHLRSTQRLENGDFFEANHLEGSVDMYSIVKILFEVGQSLEYPIVVRPDHGHSILDDLKKQTYPGYTAIGRLKGLAEIRGLELGIARSKSN